MRNKTVVTVIKRVPERLIKFLFGELKDIVIVAPADKVQNIKIKRKDNENEQDTRS